MTFTSLLEAIPLDCPRDASTVASSCVQRVEQALYAAAAALGFECVRYTCWVQDDDAASAFPRSFSINLSSFPAAWEAIYEQEKYYLVDPVARVLGMAGQSPLVYGTWQDAWQQAAQQAGNDNAYLEAIDSLLQRAGTHSLNSGVYLMLGSGMKHVIVSLGSSRAASAVQQQAQGDLFRQLLAGVSLVNQSLELTSDCTRCSKTFRVEASEPVSLTGKQSAILASFASHPSASIMEIANLHGVNPETISFHLKAIRKKFRKQQATGHALAMIARAHGLI